MAKVLMFLPPVLFAGLAAVFYLGMSREDPDGLPSTMIGREAPAVVDVAFEGAPVFSDATLQEPGLKLVNFWASWCQPCRAEAPVLEALAAEGVKIYGVNYKDTPDKASAFLAEVGNPYAGMVSDAGRMALDWGVYGVPETYVIDGEGKIVLRFAGPITKDALETTLRPAMVEAAKE